MKRNFKQPIVYILCLVMLLTTAAIPSYADSSQSENNQIYREAAIVNELDTGFEKQGEIQEVKANSFNDFRTLSTDTYNGRFALKLGKQGMEQNTFCYIINKDIDLSQYNQVSMWVKAKSYNTSLTFYTLINNEKMAIGSVESTYLKAGTWQEIKLDLSSLGQSKIPGIYAWANNNNTLLIDDIKFSKTYTNTQNWTLNQDSGNTLPSEMMYKENVGVTLKNSTSGSSLAYDTEPKVASIQNSVSGQITGINIDSSNLSNEAGLVSTGQAVSLDYIPTTNSALYSISEDGKKVFYYNQATGYVELKDRVLNNTYQIKKDTVKYIKTNEDGSMLALVDSTSTLYLIPKPESTNDTNITSQAIKVTSGAISNMYFKGDNLYYVCNDTLYTKQKDNINKSVKIGSLSYLGPESVVKYDMNKCRYNYYVNRHTGYVGGRQHYYWQVMRHDNFLNNEDFSITTLDINAPYYNMYLQEANIKVNSDGSMVLIRFENTYYLILNSNSKTPTVKTIESPLYFVFTESQVVYLSGTQEFKLDNNNTNPIELKTIVRSLDTSSNGDNLVYAENYSNVYLVNKTYSYDKGIIMQTTTGTSISDKPVSSAAIVNVKFSSLPNQVIAQMENGDIYSIDTKTKTSRLLISDMVLYKTLDNGNLLLSDMKDTGRFIIYNQVSNDKKVFRLDNRCTGAAFNLIFNQKEDSVIYLNKDNKMQEVLLNGAATKDRYALMFNNDGKWWVYKNNAWKVIYTGTTEPSTAEMDSQGMTKDEVNAIPESAFKKMDDNKDTDSLRIAVYFSSNDSNATPVLKGIKVSTEDTQASIDSKTAYGTRIKEYKKADFRDVSAIHVTENKDSADEIYYFLIADGKPYSIRNGETCQINKDASSFFGDVKGNYFDITAYGMSASELAEVPKEQLNEILIANNKGDNFGIAAVIKTIDKDTKNVKIDYVLESLQKRFDDSVKTVSLLLTDDTKIDYTEGQVTKEEIEKFVDWMMDRKYNRGPVFFTFHVGGKYKIVNYYMIKTVSVE